MLIGPKDDNDFGHKYDADDISDFEVIPVEGSFKVSEANKVYKQLRDCNWGDIVTLKEDGKKYRFVGVSGKGGPVNMLLDETEIKLIGCDLNWLVE